jgi:hypothetical protein
MNRIILFDMKGMPVFIDAEIYADKLVIHGENGSTIEIQYPIEASMFGDTLFATYDPEVQSLSPIVRKQLYSEPFSQIESLADKANVRLHEIQTFLKQISSETDPAQVVKSLQRFVKNYQVNVASTGAAHMADVVLDKSVDKAQKKIRALIDGGAEIGVADPELFLGSDLKRSSVTITGIGGSLRVPAVTVPTVDVYVNNKKYQFANMDFALLKLRNPMLLSVDVQNYIEEQEGVTAWK